MVSQHLLTHHLLCDISPPLTFHHNDNTVCRNSLSECLSTLILITFSISFSNLFTFFKPFERECIHHFIMNRRRNFAFNIYSTKKLYKGIRSIQDLYFFTFHANELLLHVQKRYDQYFFVSLI